MTKLPSGNFLVTVAALKWKSRRRRPGYLEECLRLGKVTGAGSSALVEFTGEQFADIRRRFTPADTSIKKGLGDLVHAIAGPIGRAIHWPCMEGDGSTDLKAGSPCDKIRQKLNELTPEN